MPWQQTKREHAFQARTGDEGTKKKNPRMGNFFMTCRMVRGFDLTTTTFRQLIFFPLTGILHCTRKKEKDDVSFVLGVAAWLCVKKSRHHTQQVTRANKKNATID
jgi:hypothetical protein